MSAQQAVYGSSSDIMRISLYRPALLDYIINLNLHTHHDMYCKRHLRLLWYKSKNNNLLLGKCTSQTGIAEQVIYIMLHYSISKRIALE